MRVKSEELRVKNRKDKNNSELIILNSKKGFSVLEVLLAAGMFVLFATGGAIIIVQAFNANRLGQEMTVANQFASEGIEAVKSIKNQNSGYLTLAAKAGAGNQGVTRVGGVWAFSGTSNTLTHNASDNYQRVITVTDVNRDALPPAGNITSSGTNDPDTKKITSTVTWNFNAARPEAINLITYSSDWRKPIVGGGPIMMAYSKTTSTPFYRTWDGSSWSGEGSAQAVGGNINYIVLKSSRTRNEAILGTLDSNGNIYAEVWNGTSWGTPTLMANVGSANATTRSFDIDYEKNGDRAMFVYLPNSTSVDPAYRIWNGSSWSSATIITAPPTTGVIKWIELAANPLSTSNEIALIMLDASGTTGAVYGMVWNGISWGNMGDSSVWDTSPATRDRKAIDVDYEQTSGEAMFIWGDATATDQYYRIWNGTSLTAATLLDIPAANQGVANWIELVSRPNSDELLYGVQDAAADLNTREWSGSGWDAAHTEHDGQVENITSMNFDLVWETYSANSGKAWLMYGDQATVTKKQWSGSTWGAGSVLTGSDDTSFIRLKADPASGVVFAGIYEAVAAATSNRDIWESHLTGGSPTWSAKNLLWGGPISGEPVHFRIDISTP